MQIVLNTGQSPLASYEKTKAQRGEGACPRSSVYRLPRSLAPEATPSSPGCSWVGSDEETGARQPHDGQAAWPIGTGPEPTKESPEGGDDAENQSLGQAAPAHVGQTFGFFFHSWCLVDMSLSEGPESERVQVAGWEEGVGGACKSRHFPLTAREQGFNNLLYTQQKMDSSTKGRGQLRLGTCPPHPNMGCGTNFTEPTATTKPRGVPTGGTSYFLAPPAHARSLSFSLAQETATRAAVGQGAANESCGSNSICHLLFVRLTS